MNLAVAGYQLTEVIHEGVKTIIYRGTREKKPTSAIVKTLKAEYPTLEEITWLRHEYKILHPLDIEGVVKTIALENNQNGLALILEDCGSELMKNFIESEPIDLIQFLKIAIKLASVLGELHQNNIIHKDIKPHNILINPETVEVTLIDFSIATRLSRETQTLSNPNLLEGTLAYMSPEQTGRMNRCIDYRTDFYSLGVTFYEVLTGQLPFTTHDPMELVHCHIAKKPVPPHKLNPEIPKAVSSIVMKLLAKNAEDRYQSAQGLRVDLEQCLTHLEATGKIEDFTPGQEDKCGQLLIPQKLYGREREVQILMDAFDRVGQGYPTPGSEMMLVSGYSGIGKSCLVQEVHKPIVRDRGYFTAGKFDQFKRNIPYAALIQAFQELLRQLLTESSEQIALWKEKLESALGTNCQVIIDVIPEVELIVGKKPAVPQWRPSESQNRFNRVFKQFIHVFTKKEHPLVIFLDDLQWADAASLKLIELLITDPDSQYLLTIGAYRDNEVSPTHPLMLTLEEIQQTGAIVNNITLEPLAIAHVSQLVAETLGESPDLRNPVSPRNRVSGLAELLFNKTQGNPFFLTQLLQTLHSEKLLTFDFNEGRWFWELEQIQAIGITDYNVVELVARNIQKLSEQTIGVLKLAACIGNQFNLEVLATVNEESLLTTADHLWEALQAGLILPLSNAYKIPLFFDLEKQETLQVEDLRVGYKFLHDRVQQAAYSLIPEDQKKATHLKIGKLLLQKTDKLALEENLFDLVNQLNIGLEFITHQEEKDELAKLNLMAGKKALAATAYEAAVRYLNVGLELLAENSWHCQYELALALHVEAMEAEYLNTNFERSETLAEVILQQATTLLDQVKVYELKIMSYMAQSQMLKAIDTGFYALETLGVHLSNDKGDCGFAVELPQIEELEDIPVMTDPYQLAAMRILINLAPSAYIAKPDIYPQVIFTMVNLCIKYENSPLSAHAYASYGAILCAAGDIESGYQSGELALRLLDKFDANSLKSKVYNLFNALIRHWKEHARETIAPLQSGVQSGLETGDLEWASYNAINYCTNVFLIGEPLETVADKQAQYIDWLVKIKQEFSICYATLWKQMTLNLQGLAADKYRLIGESFDEEAMLPVLEKANNGTVLFVAYLAKAILLYLFKDYAAAVKISRLAAERAEAAPGYITVAVHNFYYSLALLAQYPNAETSEQQLLLRGVAANQEKMQKWAYHAPCNFQHKYDLVLAEKARVLGQMVEAMEYYDRAILGARVQGYIQEEALANELAAEFYLSLGREKVAKTYMTEAYYGYIRWGAVAKVRDLEARYPQLICRTPRAHAEGIKVTRTTTSTTNGDCLLLDMTTVIKASQALSSEIVLSSLLEKLMKIVIENAGAQRGCLLMKQSNQWAIAAEGAIANDDVIVWQSIAGEASLNLPFSIVNYVERTKENLVLDDATGAKTFGNDEYIATKEPKSILCLPIIHQTKLTGIIYLENNLTTGVFTTERVEVLKVLTAQVSISIENARLYELEREKSLQLEQSLHKLQQTQAQLVQTEKISSLGQLVAGVAHEVNNPVSFISGNLHHASEYVEGLLKHLELYQKHLPNPPEEILENAEEIDLEYLKEDLQKMLTSMKVGTDRIRDIMQSVRNFSRIDSDKNTADIHAGIESTLMILKHRLKGKGDRQAIAVVKEYGNLPLVECYASQLNQVFMNLIANAIDALEDPGGRGGETPPGALEQGRPSPPTPLPWGEGSWSRVAPHPQPSPLGRGELELWSRGALEIRIRTEVIDGDRVAIRIKDNGPGMTEEVRSKLFDAFFTTKPVGKGTGLGLSISHQIVTKKHGGQLRCVSAPGEGTEFCIEIPITG